MVGQGEVVGSSDLVHLKGENDGMAMSGLGCGNPSVGVGEPFFLLFYVQIDLENSCLVSYRASMQCSRPIY